jgi:uncharacterized phage protein (TIGR02218 family)
MRSASVALLEHLDALRSGDAKSLIANLYTFTLRTGLVLTYTDADVPIVWNGHSYIADSVLVEGLRYKCAVGLEVDQQQIVLSARETDTVEDAPFLQALRSGVFDGCAIQRELAFLSAWNAAPVGAVIVFKGRMGTIDRIGRVGAEITVNSDLVLLDLEMPRNFYAANCQHVLYDSGCALNKEAFGANGEVINGSTRSNILWAGGSSAYSQGTITFLTGANAGVKANVKAGFTSTASNGLVLSYPLPNMPLVGDTFRVYQGCDHTKNTCLSKFNNILNFRGFPYIPPPTYAV